MASECEEDATLFGGDKGWHSKDWTASDDRVRGGKSQSYLEVSDKTGRFHGVLDIKTLGGAGFASQRTTAESQVWDLSAYSGLKVSIKKGDKKRYTLILKNELLPPNPETGREQSTVSYEVDFDVPPEDIPGESHDRSVIVPWKSFTPTYRGKPKQDAGPLDTKKIVRFSLMMRSHFGAQDGEFSLSIKSISAIAKIPKQGLDFSSKVDVRQLEDGVDEATQDARYYVWRINHMLCQAEVRIHRKSAIAVVGLAAILITYHLAFQCGW